MVFSLCFLLLLRLQLLILLCCSCFSAFLSLEVKSINCLMATSGSPALPGRQPHCANRLAPVSSAGPQAFRACRLGSDGKGQVNPCSRLAPALLQAAARGNL